MPFRTQPALKERFVEAFEQQIDFSSHTAFFEDCVRAFILARRQGKRLALPLEFVTDDKAKRDA